ncbi:hypothetical protein LSTR_LSTR006801 [Laodelphax striatellus]|uniref:Uncharacterized protein n=1 Tax=Laodelphax striatellus TaxID=195883 RepID=A0A482WSP3_LAOST|nr:hypothetical protein LSTR_LSTR006801 [Laodelphax striatellus]
MWNMMCDVMPTISEDSISQRSSQFSGEDANFEQLMVSMLDERDKLMESLRETQERLGEIEGKLSDVEKERDSLQRQISANLPQISVTQALYYYGFDPSMQPIDKDIPSIYVLVRTGFDSCDACTLYIQNTISNHLLAENSTGISSLLRIACGCVSSKRKQMMGEVAVLPAFRLQSSLSDRPGN